MRTSSKLIAGGLRRQARARAGGEGLPFAVLLLAQQCSSLSPPSGLSPVKTLATTTPWGFSSYFPEWIRLWGYEKGPSIGGKEPATSSSSMPLMLQGNLGQNPFLRSEGVGRSAMPFSLGLRRQLSSLWSSRNRNGCGSGDFRRFASSSKQPVSALRMTATGDPQTRILAEEAEEPKLGLSDPLPEHEGLKSGVLANGLRYCILRNKKPEGRFYVNLEVNAGSTDEEAHERGLAHFLEHALFLGTRKYPTQQDMKKLLRRLGMAYNADANAFTDFKTTTYTFSAPVKGSAKSVESNAGLFAGGGATATGPTEEIKVEEPEVEAAAVVAATEAGEDDADNTVLVLDLLHEMAFHARLEQKDIDMERGAVLSEIKDRDTISQRIAMEYYRFHHSDTVLPKRFPIGLERLVRNFNSSDFETFYRRHYHPANMCLYVTGDIDVSDMEAKIEQVFGGTGKMAGGQVENELSPVDWPRRGMAIEHATLLSGEALVRHEEKLREVYGEGDEVDGTDGAKALADQARLDTNNDRNYHMVSHPLISEFSVSMCTKSEESRCYQVGHLRQSLVDSLVGMVLDFRVNELRLQSKDPIFNSISWSYTSSPRDGCSTNSFSISSRPKRWKEALALGMGEAARIAVHGVTEGELSQAMTTLNNYFTTQAAMRDSLESSTWMRRIMDCVSNGDQMMAPDVKQRLLKQLAEGLSEAEVSARAAQLFAPFLRYADGTDGAERLSAERDGMAMAKGFVSMPAPGTYEEGSEMHVAGYSKDEFFRQIKQAVQDPAPPDFLQVPEALADEAAVDVLVSKAKPAIVSREEEAIGPDEGKLVRLKLSNGVRVSYRRNTARPQEFRVRVSAVGGRAMESVETRGHAVAGAALWINGGAGGHAAEVVSRFASMHQLSYDCSCGSETLNFDLLVHTTVEGATARALSVLWLYMSQPLLDPKALDRFKSRIKRSEQSFSKSVERTTTHKLISCLFDQRTRWRLEELPYEVAKEILPEDVQRLLEMQLVPSNLEVAISGDFEPEELERELVRYMGILGAGEGAGAEKQEPWRGREEVFRLHYAAGSKSLMADHIVDDTERATVMMAFPSVNRWGQLKRSSSEGVEIDLVGGKGLDLIPAALTSGAGGEYCRAMHVSRCMSIANDIISNRLFEEIREKRGLVYSIGFSWRPYRLLSGGYCMVSFMPKFDQVPQSVEQVKAVMQSILADGFTDEEFQGSKGPLVTKVRETEKQNVFWVQLMEDLGNDVSPKSVDCIRQVADHYETLTKEMVLEVVREAMGHCLDNLSIAAGSSGPKTPEALLL